MVSYYYCLQLYVYSGKYGVMRSLLVGWSVYTSTMEGEKDLRKYTFVDNKHQRRKRQFFKVTVFASYTICTHVTRRNSNGSRKHTAINYSTPFGKGKERITKIYLDHLYTLPKGHFCRLCSSISRVVIMKPGPRPYT